MLIITGIIIYGSTGWTHIQGPLIFYEACEFGFDIDTPTDIVQAHMHDQAGVIPKETFGQLLPESWKAWSQLSDDIRVDILRPYV
jgi:hypothetical protein